LKRINPRRAQILGVKIFLAPAGRRAGRRNRLSSVFADAHYERGILDISRWTITSHGSARHLR
jgi:hypothetical protein